MTPKRQRLTLIAAGMVMLAAGAALLLLTFRDNLVFFVTPSELAERPELRSRMLRIGGLVEEGSITKQPDGSIRFTVTDQAATLPVRAQPPLPDLFREGQGVVAEGRFGSDDTFEASRVLAKHDENYMPPQVVEALKKSGRWQTPATDSGAPR